MSERSSYYISVGRNEDNLHNFPGQVKYLTFMKGDNEYFEAPASKGCSNEDINPSEIPSSELPTPQTTPTVIPTPE